jgi:parvulin-like peptidyl-prolyl isomerase
MVSRIAPLLAGSFALLAVNCGKQEPGPAPLADNVLALVGTEVITVEDFQKAMTLRPADGEAARNALLDEMILFRAQLQEARARGYDRDPEIAASYERLLTAKVRSEILASIEKSEAITPAAIEEHYRTHAADFAIPTKIRVAMIHVEAPTEYTPEKRAERKMQIEEARAKASTQPDRFASIVAEYSHDQATKHRGGDLGYFVEGMEGDAGMEREIVTVAFTLKHPGELSGIITTGAGFYFLKLTERQAASTRTLTHVQDGIRQRLLAEMRVIQEAQFSERLLAGRVIDVRRERLATIPATPQPEVIPAQPPTVPGGK